MWLLNVNTRKLEHFMDDRHVHGLYAILSHTWGNEEVSFDEIHLASSMTKQGFQKIEYTCRQALEHGLSYVWIDTCCIDKRSSAELSQAINSMYRWYSNAQICYLYLSDLVQDSRHISGNPSLLKLRRCRWFTRGWTLQELIAPEKLMFFDAAWNFVALKSEITSVLREITSIDQEILVDRDRLEHASVANRMSWASERTTTQVEDQAYSLLGIFNINMPLLYGEGPKAFLRFQEEIIRTWTRVDHSILAWHGRSSGLLAISPAQFPVHLPESITLKTTGSRDPIKRNIISWSLPYNEIFELSNKGLRISLYARSTGAYARDKGLSAYRQDTEDTERLIVALNCAYSYRKDELFAMYLSRRPWIHTGVQRSKNMAEQDYAIYDFESQYTTVRTADLSNFNMVTLTIARTLYPAQPSDVLVQISWEAGLCSVKATLPSEAWLSDGRSLYLNPLKVFKSTHSCAYLLLDLSWHQILRDCSLTLDTTKMSRLQLPRIYMEIQESGSPSYGAKEIKSGERRILELRGKEILHVFAKYLLVNGKIVWDLTITDPPGEGDDMRF